MTWSPIMRIRCLPLDIQLPIRPMHKCLPLRLGFIRPFSKLSSQLPQLYTNSGILSPKHPQVTIILYTDYICYRSLLQRLWVHQRQRNRFSFIVRSPNSLLSISTNYFYIKAHAMCFTKFRNVASIGFSLTSLVFSLSMPINPLEHILHEWVYGTLLAVKHPNT